MVDAAARSSSRAGPHGRCGEYPFELHRHGANHDVYRLDLHTIPVPRHREINQRLAEGILRDARRFLETT
jgi:mRNA interferase HicA